MIQVYKVDNTDFDRNGDITLLPTEAYVHAVLNGSWEAHLEHPIDPDARWKYLTEEAVVKMPSFNGEQLFRIKHTEKSDNGIVCDMEPIFYDSMGDCWLRDVRPTGKNGQQALDIILSPNKKYSGSSNITRTATAYYQNKNFIEALNGDNPNSFVNRWGGEILFDNFNVIVNERVGGDYGVELRYGKNIPKDGLIEEIDTGAVVTRIYPKAYNGHELSGNGYVDSPLIGNYPTIKTATITFDDIKMAADVNEDAEDNGAIICNDQTELDAALRKRCQEQFGAGLDKPKITIEADMILLQNTELYKDYKVLEEVGFGDTIHCRHKRLDITTDARVIELKYNSIKKCVESVVLGDFQYNFFNDISSVVDRIEGVINPDGSIMAEKVQGILNGIYTQLKLQSTVAQKVKGRAFTVEDLDPDSLLYGCMTWGTQGLQLATKRTADGRDWDWTTAITAQGIVADAIITGLLSDKTGRNFWNLDTGEFRLSAEAFMVDDDTLEDYINGKVEDAAAQIRLLTMQLSNDMCSVATGADGTGGDYSECYTEVMLLIGTTDITNDERVRYTVNASAGVDGNWDLTRKRYSVTGMSEDNGSVTITADYSGITVSKVFSISKSKAGQDGEGVRVYMLQADTTVIKQGADDTYSPRYAEFTAVYKDGKDAQRQKYYGRFRIEESETGSSFSTKYLSKDNEASHWHYPSTKNVKLIKCTLYAQGGTTEVLDVQTVAIVRDIDNLTQEGIFNTLTNNGTAQGIFMKDGQIYINMAYLQTGVLKLGGVRNEDGVQEIFNSSGRKTGRIDNDGLTFFYEYDTVNNKFSGIRLSKAGIQHIEDAIFVEFTDGSGTDIEIIDPGLANSVIGFDPINKAINGDFGFLYALSARLNDVLDMTVSGYSTFEKAPVFNSGINVKAGVANFPGWNINGKYINSYDGGIKIGDSSGVKRLTSADFQIKYGLDLYLAGQTGGGGDFTDGGNPFQIHGMGTGTGSSLVIRYNRVYKTSSSKRYKTIGRNVSESDLEEWYQIQPVWAKYKNDFVVPQSGCRSVVMPMLIAEDVQSHIPTAAVYGEGGQIEDWSERVMIPAMFAMIKNQKEQIDILKKEMKELKNLLNSTTIK